MRRLLFLLTLTVYGFSALELHEWLHVPQVVMHFLEQHTSEDFHDPFSEDCHGEFCACSGLVALSPVNRSLLISLQPLTTKVGAQFLNVAPSGFTGNVWIPPKA